MPIEISGMTPINTRRVRLLEFLAACKGLKPLVSTIPNHDGHINLETSYEAWQDDLRCTLRRVIWERKRRPSSSRCSSQLADDDQGAVVPPRGGQDYLNEGRYMIQKTKIRIEG